MLDLLAPFFKDLYARTGLNFIVFYDPYEFGRLLNGAAISAQLIVWSLLLSLVIGIVGAWVQSSQSAVLRGVVNAYIQAFRNTPPMIQLLFFYFGLGAFTPTVDMGGYSQPLISSFTWAVLSLGIFGGAFNVEIFRAGLQAVPHAMLEAAESLCFSRWQTYRYVTLPLAFRISLPALTNNLISLAKTSSLAYVISVPEMTYVLSQVWSDNINVPEMMLLLFAFYLAAVWIIGAMLHWLERRLALPGYGQ